MYWGYNVRVADSLESVFKECPYEGGYDWDPMKLYDSGRPSTG